MSQQVKHMSGYGEALGLILAPWESTVEHSTGNGSREEEEEEEKQQTEMGLGKRFSSTTYAWGFNAQKTLKGEKVKLKIRFSVCACRQKQYNTTSMDATSKTTTAESVQGYKKIQ